MPVEVPKIQDSIAAAQRTGIPGQLPSLGSVVSASIAIGARYRTGQDERSFVPLQHATPAEEEQSNC